MPLRMLKLMGLVTGKRVQLARAGDSHTLCKPVILRAPAAAYAQGLAKSIAWDGEGATCLMEARPAPRPNVTPAGCGCCVTNGS